MYIRKRLNKYYVEIKRQGHKDIYKTFKQKSDAMKWGRSVEIQLDQSRYKDTSNASKTTLKSVMERHLKECLRLVREPKKEQSRYNVIIKNDIVKRYLTNLTPLIFARYRDQRLDEGLSPSTVCRELSFMSVSIKKAIRFYNCWLPEHPIPNDIKPKESAPRNRRLEEGEFDKLMEHCKTKRNSYWCYMIEFSIQTAMRLNEQLTLKWEQVDLKNMMITILAEHSKTGIERLLSLFM